MPLPVSVQICTLNEEGNIGECLETVVANDPEEIVVIDGGSTDRTVEIAESMGARVLAPGRLGLGPSRQLGYRSTTSRYTAFVDADDRLGPDWLATMVRELEAGGYSALQSSLRAVESGNWWSPGWNQYFIESVRPTADTTMVGRPALFVDRGAADATTRISSPWTRTRTCRGSFELRGLRQGIGTADRLPARRGDVGGELPQVAVLRTWLPGLRRRASRAAVRDPPAHAVHGAAGPLVATRTAREGDATGIRGAHGRRHPPRLELLFVMPRNLRHTLGRDGSGSRTHLPHAYPKVDHRRIQVVATPIEARQNALANGSCHGNRWQPEICSNTPPPSRTASRRAVVLRKDSFPWKRRIRRI